MPRQMLINVREKEESRIAILQDGKLEQYHVERASHATRVGNIYKGRVEDIHPSLQAAFVNIGLERKGFLHVSETIPDPATHRHSIQQILQRGQEILVQVIRDEFEEKGPSISMQISLPGRYLVLTPMSQKIGVSKKIVDRSKRGYLKGLLRGLASKHGLGFIMRTASTETTRSDLKADLEYLIRVWLAILSRGRSFHAPALLYQESDLVTRTVRDEFDRSIDELLVDELQTFNRLQELFSSVLPRYRRRLKFYRDHVPLFHKFNVEDQIRGLNQRTVPLSSGGYITIEPTDALIAIDVNSGRFTKGVSPEDTAFRTNLESAREIMRQLRLRDLGGIIVVDYIDMKEKRHRLAVQQAMYQEAKKDRSQIVILPMSRFCIVEIARQKIRPSLQLFGHSPCPACKGSGLVRDVQSIGIELLRRLNSLSERQDVYVVELSLNPEVANFLSCKAQDIAALESKGNKRVHIHKDPNLGLEEVKLTGYNIDGIKVFEAD